MTSTLSTSYIQNVVVMHRAAAGHFWNLASAQWVKKNSVAESKFKQIIYNALNEIWYQIRALNQLTIKKTTSNCQIRALKLYGSFKKSLWNFENTKIRVNDPWEFFSAHCALHWRRTFAVCKVLFFLGVECGQLVKNSYCDPWDLDSRVQQLKPALHCSL